MGRVGAAAAESKDKKSVNEGQRRLERMRVTAGSGFEGGQTEGGRGKW